MAGNVALTGVNFARAKYPWSAILTVHVAARFSKETVSIRNSNPDSVRANGITRARHLCLLPRALLEEERIFSPSWMK
jgi:hypothetical protein